MVHNNEMKDEQLSVELHRKAGQVTGAEEIKRQILCF
jgi:hypothetical protein